MISVEPRWLRRSNTPGTLVSQSQTSLDCKSETIRSLAHQRLSIGRYGRSLLLRHSVRRVRTCVRYAGSVLAFDSSVFSLLPSTLLGPFADFPGRSCPITSPRNFENEQPCNGLVKKSTSILSVGQWSIHIIFVLTWSAA